MQNKDKDTLLRDDSTEESETHAVFDPLALMATVARQEANACIGDTLLRAGQTLYAPSDINAGKLKRTRPDGIIEEGTFSDGKFISDF